MGLCLSKKKKQQQPPPSTPSSAVPPCCSHGDKILEKRKDKKKIVIEMPGQKTVVAQVPAEKKLQVFVDIPIPKKCAAASFLTAGDEKKKDEASAILAEKVNDTGGIAMGDPAVVGLAVEDFKPTPVRTSSCTKEEVDAILIQCGRLSRSSSGTGLRRYSGSKRSYDFDNEKKTGEEEGEDWEGRPVSRPSPRRRTPGRDRSWSRERTGSGAAGGGRRVSRSPGRRSEAPAASGSGSERSRQPTKMVSVPAREKAGRGVSPTATANRRGGETGPARTASPRSRSPANACRISNENTSHHNASKANLPQSLSRSSSRKAEQSPCRRNPMAEIHDNTLKGHQNSGHEFMIQKATQVQSQKSSENSAPLPKSEHRAGGGTADASNAAKTKQIQSRKTKDQETEPEIEEEAMEKSTRNGTAETLNVGFQGTDTRVVSRTMPSRRCSTDLDCAIDGLSNVDNILNPNSYASMLLEDIQNYHRQHQGTAFSLPTCVSKACSILEAVADLNSSSSEIKNSEGERSTNGNVLSGIYGRTGSAPKEPTEPEIMVKNDLMEPSLHKYATVRDSVFEMEPQESAGSNSFVGQPWASPWGPDSVNSADPYWTSSSINGDEVEQGTHLQQPASHESEAPRKLRGCSGNNSFMAPTSSSKRRELQHHNQLPCTGSSIIVASGRT